MATEARKQKLSEVMARLVGTPVDIASLAAFRFLFGLLMAAAMLRFISKGWVRQLYVAPTFHFAYPGFGWIHPWPDAAMHAHFVLLALLALGVAMGFFYRICITLFFLGFTYIELIDQTAYLNHYYLISLMSGLMIFLPADRAWSLDAWRKPEIRVDAVPAWTLNILRFQVAVVYLFAGLAKFSSDWLLEAEPLRVWFAARSDLPLIGPWLNEAWVAYAASWFGAFFDSGIVFFLLCKSTRRVAFVFVIVFHVATWVLFNIGMFPWIMIVAATLLFPADWPRHWLSRLSRAVSHAGKWVPLARQLKAASAIKYPPRVQACRRSRVLLTALGAYAAVQVAFPLRPYFSSQPSAWTCSGFNCAWQVMLVEKTGYVEFNAFDPAVAKVGRLTLTNYLTPRQEMMMAQDPYLIRAMARRLAADLKGGGFTNAEIRVNAFATLNGRPSQRLINPDIDLAGTLAPGWILPLTH